MEFLSAIKASKTLLQIGQELATVVQQAQTAPNVVERVLLYLHSAQMAVHALGKERQGILSDVRRCDVADKAEVDALWQRLDSYLHQDHIRPQLQHAIQGLKACSERIEREADHAWWRKRDKQAAVDDFIETLGQLETTLQELSHNFYPGGSGMGVYTLQPMLTLLTRIRQESRTGQQDEDYLNNLREELGEYACVALRDSSHEQWFRTAGAVEALVTELQLAFNYRTPLPITELS